MARRPPSTPSTKCAAHLEHAVELVGDDPTIVEHLGDAYQAQGRSPEALRVYRDAAMRSKDKAQVDRLKDKIDGLEGHRRKASNDF